MNWQYASTTPPPPEAAQPQAGGNYLDAGARAMQAAAVQPLITVKNMAMQSPSAFVPSYIGGVAQSAAARQVYQQAGSTSLAAMSANLAGKPPAMNRSAMIMAMAQDRRKAMDAPPPPGANNDSSMVPSIMRDTVIMTGPSALGLEGVSFGGQLGGGMGGGGQYGAFGMMARPMSDRSALAGGVQGGDSPRNGGTPSRRGPGKVASLTLASRARRM